MGAVVGDRTEKAVGEGRTRGAKRGGGVDYEDTFVYFCGCTSTNLYKAIVGEEVAAAFPRIFQSKFLFSANERDISSLSYLFLSFLFRHFLSLSGVEATGDGGVGGAKWFRCETSVRVTVA